jgi:hypothetical protein
VVLAGILLSTVLMQNVKAQSPNPQNLPESEQRDRTDPGSIFDQDDSLPQQPGSTPGGTSNPLRKTPSRGGINAKIILSPICSVVAAAGDCAARPYVGAIRIERLTNRVSGRNRVIRTQTDNQGRMQIRLEPGVYTVQPLSGSFPVTLKETVRVFPQRMKTLDIVFRGTVPTPVQRGIRQ